MIKNVRSGFENRERTEFSLGVLSAKGGRGFYG